MGSGTESAIRARLEKKIAYNKNRRQDPGYREQQKVRAALWYAKVKGEPRYQEKQAAYRLANKEKLRAWRAQYRGRPGYREQQKAYFAEWRAAHPEWAKDYVARRKADPALRKKDIEKQRARSAHRQLTEPAYVAQRRAHQLRMWGWTLAGYSLALQGQAGLCAICGAPPGKKALHADHDHTTKRARALLCTRCNLGLGSFRDDVGLLSLRAPQYLQHPFEHAIGPELPRQRWAGSDLSRYYIAGWTPTAYKSAIDRQCGLCEICGGHPSKRGLYADHDHVTGRPRALLCVRCNSGLGSFRDNPELLHRAADYVEHWREVHSAVPATVTFTVDLETFDLIRPFL